MFLFKDSIRNAAAFSLGRRFRIECFLTIGFVSRIKFRHFTKPLQKTGAGGFVFRVGRSGFTKPILVKRKKGFVSRIKFRHFTKPLQKTGEDLHGLRLIVYSPISASSAYLASIAFSLSMMLIFCGQWDSQLPQPMQSLAFGPASLYMPDREPQM